MYSFASGEYIKGGGQMVVPPTGKLCTHRLHFREIHEKCAPATSLIDRCVAVITVEKIIKKIILE